jgi:RNA polymerase sigma factor (sigma-70 family)
MTKSELEEYWKIYHPKVFGFFYKRVNIREDVEELSSHVMFVFLDRLQDDDYEIRNERAYLWQIAKNQLMKFIRNKEKDKIISIDDLDSIDSDQYDFDYSDEGIHEYRAKEYSDRVEKLLECVKKVLKDIDFLIVKKTILDEKTSTELQKELGLKADNIRKKLSRGMQRVRLKCKQLWTS